MSRILFGLYDDESLWLACALDEGELWPPIEIRTLAIMFAGFAAVYGGPGLAVSLMQFGRPYEHDAARHRAIFSLEEGALWLCRRTILRSDWQRGKTAKGNKISDLLERLDAAIMAEHERTEGDVTIFTESDQDHLPDPDPVPGAEAPVRPGENEGA